MSAPAIPSCLVPVQDVPPTYALTVTVAVAVPILPAISLALKVIVVVDAAGKVAGALFVTETAPSMSSVADVVARNTAITASVAGVPETLSAATLIFAGTVTTGGVVSPLLPPPVLQAMSKNIRNSNINKRICWVTAMMEIVAMRNP